MRPVGWSTLLLVSAVTACAGRSFRASDPANDPAPPTAVERRAASPDGSSAPSETRDAADAFDAHHAPPATTSTDGERAAPTTER